MNLPGSSFFAATDQAARGPCGRTEGLVVVWLQGEHDLSTDEPLSRALAGAIALDSAGLVLDLGQVTFLALSTLRVIVRARQLLRHQSRSLTVRSASASARRAMHACGLDDLAGASPQDRSAGPLDDRAGHVDGGGADMRSPETAIEAKRTSTFPNGEGRLARSGR
jgi:anti-anti-sigma factor